MCRIYISYNYQTLRTICTSSLANSKSYAAREGRFMRKITKSDSKSGKWYNHVGVENNKFQDKTKKTVHPMVQRRMNVLNKLFMEHVTDLMATGETSTELLQRGIEVTCVKIPPSFQVVNVYWIASEDEYHSYDIKTEEVLNKCALSVRHELSQLRIMGVVPPIQFVKDKQFDQLKQIDSRLSSIESEECIGPDYVSESSFLPVTNPQTLDGSLEIKPDTDDEDRSTLPEMRHDVLGLNYKSIMNQIKASLNQGVRDHASLKITPFDKQEFIKSQSTNAMQFFTSKEQKDLLDGFLRKQRSEARNIYKQSKKAESNRFEETFESNPFNIYDNDYQYDDGHLDEDDHYQGIDITYNDDSNDNLTK